MADNLTYRFFYAGILFNLLFSIMGFAFTTFPTVGSNDLDIPLNQDALMSEGIIFENATYYNVSYKDGWHYLPFNDGKMRLEWGDWGIAIQKQGLIQSYIDSWLFPDYLSLGVGEDYTLINYPIERGIRNSTIITYWEPDNNWTRFRTGNFFTGFITPRIGDEMNITKAIYDTGNVTVTVGELQLEPDMDIRTFANWYWNTLFKFQYQGFPSVLNAILQIIVIVNLVSGILVIREQLRI